MGEMPLITFKVWGYSPTAFPSASLRSPFLDKSLILLCFGEDRQVAAIFPRTALHGSEACY